MSISSATPISFKTKEGASEPQQAFDITTKTPRITDENGNVISWNFHHFVGDLHTKTLVVEGRGYSAENHPEASSQVTTKGWKITQKDDAGEMVAVTEGSFAAKSVVVESHRINDAGMWRATKTVTIKALYVNGVMVEGISDFDTGDYTI
jgi:hypothetical protein